MIRNILIIFLLLFSFSISAQNYKLINPERSYYYVAGGEGEIYSIRIDSIEVAGNDSILYNYKQLTPYNADFKLSHKSWLGEKIIMRDSLTIIISLEGDSIFLNPKANLNDEWLYSNKDSVVVTAAVTNIVYKEIFQNVFDSVKIITLTARDLNHTIIPNFLNNPGHEFSKSYGITSLTDQRYFPYNNYYNGPSMKLVGITNPDQGIKNPTALSIYNFNPGDEIHYGDFLGILNHGYENTYRLYTFLDKAIIGDTIVFTTFLRYFKDKMIFQNQNYTYTKTEDTVIIKYSLNPELSALSNEPTLNGIVKWQVSEDSCMETTEKIFLTYYNRLNDSIYIITHPDPQNSVDWIYIDQLGGPLFKQSISSSYYLTGSGIIYYKKGNVTCGAPLNFNSLNVEEPIQDLKINVVATNEYLKISTSLNKANLNIKIIDISGRLIFSSNNITSSENHISIKHLSSGMYIYLIEHEKNVNTGKFIKY